MKKIKLYTLLTISILIPQIAFPNYLAIILSWVAIGSALAYLENVKRIFWTGFLLQTIIASMLFTSFSGNNSTFFSHVMENLGLPGFVFAAVFIIFNAINVGACLYIGSKLLRLVSPQKEKIA